MGVIIYNEQYSSSYGIVVEHPPSYAYAERDYEKIHIPGRNGDILLDYGAYKNVERTYEIAAGSYSGPAVTHFANISSWLHSGGIGYHKLSDTYEPDYFRMAAYVEKGDITNILGRAGRATITFDCRPQRFLNDGDSFVTVTESTILRNYWQPAQPLIDIKGTGDCMVGIGNYPIVLTGLAGEIFIDCETLNCYYNGENLNSIVQMPAGFPVLDQFETTFAFSENITEVKIKPRWWVL